MKNFTPEVLNAIQGFVEQGQSFISLDIYCKLGVRINDDEFPIHQQVRDAYAFGKMKGYLSEWVTIKLEHGGYANVWRYYLPKLDYQIFDLKVRKDDRVEIGRKTLGHFPLLDTPLRAKVSFGEIKLALDIKEPDFIIPDLSDRVCLKKSTIQSANLLNKPLQAKVYPDKILILEKE